MASNLVTLTIVFNVLALSVTIGITIAIIICNRFLNNINHINEVCIKNPDTYNEDYCNVVEKLKGVIYLYKREYEILAKM